VVKYELKNCYKLFIFYALIKKVDKTEVHIGKLIKEQVNKKNMNICDFAQKIHCVRENVYYIFRSPSIDINRLIMIGKVLDYDFVKEIYTNTLSTEITLHLNNIHNEQQYTQILIKLQEIADLLHIS
jgi:hypothetical protein